MMDIAAVKELIAALEDSRLYSLQYEDAAFRVALAKGPQGAALSAAAGESTAPPAAVAPAAQAAPERGVTVSAPLVGTVYRSREPGGEPLVSVGDRVEKGQALCLIEAMKMYSEVPSPCTGRVAEILFDDGTLAEYGAVLFRLEKDA